MDRGTGMNKTKTEQAGVQIMLLLNQYKTVSWSIENINKHISGSIADAVEWLKDNRLVNGRSKLFLTELGFEYLDGLEHNVSMVTAASEFKFKNEALSGLTEMRSRKTGLMVSERSELTAAVLPEAHKPTTNTTPEDLILRKQRELEAKQKLAGRLKITTQELECHIASGRLRFCKGCESLQLFDSNGKGTWRSKCRKCRKK